MQRQILATSTNQEFADKTDFKIERKKYDARRVKIYIKILHKQILVVLFLTITDIVPSVDKWEGLQEAVAYFIPTEHTFRNMMSFV